jgi:hypothetical protein
LLHLPQRFSLRLRHVPIGEVILQCLHCTTIVRFVCVCAQAQYEMASDGVALRIRRKKRNGVTWRCTAYIYKAQNEMASHGYSCTTYLNNDKNNSNNKNKK